MHLSTFCASTYMCMFVRTQLPIWLNVYITANGRSTSAPAHTDKQDVIAVQVFVRVCRHFSFMYVCMYVCRLCMYVYM
jgi:hypothetical protein